MGQPIIIASLEKKLFEDVAKGHTTLTPGTGTEAVDEASIVPPEQQNKYNSRVGTLLYLTKELSKTMDKPTYSQYKEMLWVIESVLESKDKGLKMNPICFLHALWKLQALSDTDWGSVFMDSGSTSVVYKLPGNAEAFHQDGNLWTVNVALNDDTDYMWGQLLLSTIAEIHTIGCECCKAGDATCHAGYIQHGVLAIQCNG